MIRPGKRMLALLVLPLGISILSWNGSGRILWVFNLSLLLLFSADLVYSLPRRDLHFDAQIPALFSIGRPGRILFRLRSAENMAIRYALPQPESFLFRFHRGRLLLKAGRTESLEVEFHCSRRGRYKIPVLNYLRRSSLGFWWIPGSLDPKREISITPDVESIRTYFQMARMNRLDDLGFHRQSRAGGAMEIHHLRPYMEGEDSRRIDWKASTRLGRPVTKVFDSESSSQIYLVLDTGRLMSVEAVGMSLLDHAINAALLLSDIALRMGDSVGIITVADRIKNEIKPIRGKGASSKILTFLSTLEISYTDTNFPELFAHINRRAGKRSLIILLSDFSDALLQKSFQNPLSVLAARHMIFLLMLRDRGLEEWSKKEQLHQEEDFFTRTAAREFLLNRIQGIQTLQEGNIIARDVLPEEIQTTLINQYMQLRSGNRI